jgi:hypothetical protein
MAGKITAVRATLLMMFSVLVRRCVYLLSGCAALYGVERFCHGQTDGFSILKVTSSLTPRPEWECSGTLPPLNQPFVYLGRGVQCYAFSSQDGRYVLKLFRHDRMRRAGKLEKTFASYKLAFDAFRAESGLLYMHLNKTHHLNQRVTIYDKLGIAHTLPLDRMEFLLQERADLVYPHLVALMRRGALTEAQEALAQLVRLLVFRAVQGIADKDPNLLTNFGFARGRAIQIDVGRFSRTEAPSSREAIIRMTDPLKKRLQADYPLLAQNLEEHIRALPDQITDVQNAL